MTYKYKIGDKISCYVNSKKVVIYDVPEEAKLESFQIIYRYILGDKVYYSILIPDDYYGWTISKFHIEHTNVAKVFLGKRFYDVPEWAIS